MVDGPRGRQDQGRWVNRRSSVSASPSLSPSASASGSPSKSPSRSASLSASKSPSISPSSSGSSSLSPSKSPSKSPSLSASKSPSISPSASLSMSPSSSRSASASASASPSPSGSTDPVLGAHEGTFYPYQSTSATTITTDPMTTQATGSSMIVGLARASSATAAPTDNKGNTYAQLGTAHPYTDWPSWGTSLWADATLTGGTGHTVSAATPALDEITLFAVEVQNGGMVKDYVHAQNTSQSPLVSGNVTTTGPALLIAFWWGNGDGSNPHTAVPNNGFTVIESVLGAGSLIQGACAIRQVATPGTYNVSWTSGDPGGQTWLVAVQFPTASTSVSKSPSVSASKSPSVSPSFSVSASPSPSASEYTPDRYISPSGSNALDGLTPATAWKTFAYAFANMGAGNTLGLLDGTYSEAAGTGYISYLGTNSGQPPSGSSINSQTVVTAVNPGSVFVDGLFIGRSFRKDSYITIHGITFGGGALYNTSYVTVKECGFRGTFGIGTNDHDQMNTRNLIEDVWIRASGQRIIASNYRAHENVWRRVIVRGDGCGQAACQGSGNPNVGFTCYDSHDCSFQNVIVIDRILLTGDEPYADFATAQHTDGSLYLLGRNEWLGCMSVKAPDNALVFEGDNTIQGGDPTWTLTNFAVWDPAGAALNLGGGAYNGGQKAILTNITAGSAGETGVRLAPGKVTAGSVTNILVSNVGGYGVNSSITPTYCNVYGAAAGAYNQTTCTVGAFTYNVEGTGDLPFFPRIEADSVLHALGSGGADIGANIVYRYGVDGTRYGDSGVNLLTGDLLWPWPNQTRIRKEMGTDLGITRGFCAAGQTLTKYIWEYLGNTSPY